MVVRFFISHSPERSSSGLAGLAQNALRETGVLFGVRLRLFRDDRVAMELDLSAVALVVADLAFGRFGRGRGGSKQWLEAVPENLQRGVVLKEGFVNFGEALQNDGIAGEGLALFHEGTDDIDTHLRGPLGTQDVRGHQGAVFGEDPWRIAPPAMSLT